MTYSIRCTAATERFNSKLDTLDKIRTELYQMARDEATNLFRLARKAEAHGVSQKTVIEIREEAWELETTIKVYPDRLLTYEYISKTKYAFR